MTDFNIPPFFFNISDLLENSGIDPATNLRNTGKYPCTQKYFSDFEFADYQIQLSPPLDHPVYVEPVTAGTTSNVIGQVYQRGSGGLKVGSYQYALRFTNISGNITPFTEATPMIPVPMATGNQSVPYPNIKTYGGAVGTVSTLGNHIRFRVTNTLNYDTLEVRRISFNVGAAIGTTGLDEIIAQIPITAGEIGIIDFFDYDNTSIEAVTNAVASDNITAIQAAKAIRYYNSRLFLFNIKYASRDLLAPGNAVTFNKLNNQYLIPFVDSLGPNGYRDTWNTTYRRNYRRQEQYGFGLLGYDSNAGTSFVLPIPVNPTTPNMTMPSRRSEMGSATLYPNSLVLSPALSNNRLLARAVGANTGQVNQTFEIFDLVGAVNKNGPPETIGILDLSFPNANEPYGIFHPTDDEDINVTEMELNPSNAVFTVEFNSGLGPYAPLGFAPNIYALGVSFQGMQSYPSWIKAFSVVRTAPAGRVLCQGQSFYSPYLNVSSNTGKEASGIFFDSPDIYSGIVPTSQITNNLTRYEAYMVSPLGCS